MGDDEKPTVEFNLGGGTKRFSSSQELAQWIDELEQSFRWVTTTRAQVDTPFSRAVEARYREAIAQFRSFLAKYDELASRKQLQQQFDQILGQIRERGGLVTRESPNFDFIEVVRAQQATLGTQLEADQAGVAALYSLIGEGASHNINPSAFDRTAAWAGVIALHSMRAGGSSSDVAAKQMQLDRLAEETRETITRRQREFDALSEQQTSLLGQSKQEALDQAEILKQEVAAAIDRIQVVEHSYRTQMALQAPVEYWAEKATSHADAAKTYRWWLTGLGSGSVVALCILYAFGLQLLATGMLWDWKVLDTTRLTEAMPIHLTVYVTGFLALLTTLVLWMFRVLMRLYMSHTHLSVDAGERVVMLKAFLAMQADAQVSDADKALILPALFRSSADGIVKDDSAPNLSGPAILAALLDTKQK